jgi:hypothetical protein
VEEKIEKKFTHANFGTPEINFRSCDWPSCTLEGIHRAPKSQEEIQEYSWFCIEHVRIYNSSWNYYEGISHEEFDELVRSNTTWNRPTWPLNGRQRNVLRQNDDDPFDSDKIGINYENFSDPFGIFTKDIGFKKPTEQSPRNSLSVGERKALSLLNFDALVKKSELKARYKLLVKKYHPDRTGGNKKLEERFKQINEAYELVMARLTKN